jgi:hypothetical protein
MKPTWRTLWVQNDIVVYRDEIEVDRLPGDRIARVHLLYRGQGDTPGDIAQSVVELAGDDGYAVFEAETGFAGRVNFERQAFWCERQCVYWVPAASAVLPSRLRVAAWRGDVSARAFRRIARDDLAAAVERWPIDVPQTWEDRKRRRIERSRPFGYAHGVHA